MPAWLHRRPFVHYAADIWTDGVIALGAPRFVVAVMRGLERFTLRRAALRPRKVLSFSGQRDCPDSACSGTRRASLRGAQPAPYHV